jgi:predicted type IV restriction endonuclease
MGDQQDARLHQVTKEIVTKIQKFRERGLNLGEQNTKASLIEPILEALGWDIRDPDEVHREFKPTTKDSPVDYALSLIRKPKLFVEAKGLGEELSDRKWIAQVLGYAVVAGVEWCILTDGDEYRFYNATAAVDADDKLFCRIKLSQDQEEDAVKSLFLISRSNMTGNILNDLWNAYFVDQRVKQALQVMLTAPEKGIVRLIRRRISKLRPKEIVQSLRRLDFRIESPTPIPELSGQVPKPKSKAKAQAGKLRLVGPKSRQHFQVTLADLINGGLLSAPLKLFRNYKGKAMEASLLSDGSVEFEGHTYKSCSTAAEIARSKVTGRKMNTNGWSFWQFHDNQGNSRMLIEIRDKFIAMKTKMGS